MTSPRRSLATASPSGTECAAMSSTGTSWRIDSSGPRAAVSLSISPSTRLLLGPTPTISLITSGSGTRLVNPAAPAGRTGSARSASASTRLSTPTVSGLPHSGQSPPCARV